MEVFELNENEELTSAEKGINLEQMDICKSHLEKWESESWRKARAYLEDIDLRLNQADGIFNSQNS